MVKLPKNNSVVPYSFRFNKLLNANEKLLLAEIKLLCGRNGHCWPKNRYFAELFNRCPKTISRWLKKLEKLGFIRIEFNRLQCDRRDIYFLSLPGTNVGEGGDNSAPGEGQKCPPLYNKNDKSNDNRNEERERKLNSRSVVVDNSSSFSKMATPSVEEVKDYISSLFSETTPTIRPADVALKFHNYYSAKGWKMGSSKMEDWRAGVKNWISKIDQFEKNDNRHNQPGVAAGRGRMAHLRVGGRG
ncbi:helix-turn-helix domain-containing protein [Pontibacter sp. HSC-14F20]|uniref:helix-turn-helix domain-containing protein n=1 Tax=Pontibacter sp. HSC-14F20 TaxID=2864136 RepID=UPI001C7335C0|nr:helix-turn-helix domain-containing protein [Pontibacter sp. HSC-14F20]MBX0334324.1 helix-turn-helix domain-containing protein [Pontibacter sp. HSC-14F20]